MAIQHNPQIKLISEEEFHLLDYEIMGLIFSIHSELGRFWNEKIYQNTLAYRCQKAGYKNVKTEVPIQISYKDFNKFYYVDLLVNDAVIYELKAVQTLTGQHRKQTLNYLFLMGMQHGKLINMRSPSVEHNFVSTRITQERRYNVTIEDQEWREIDEDSIRLKQLLIGLLNEWGAFLDTNLFYFL